MHVCPGLLEVRISSYRCKYLFFFHLSSLHFFFFNTSNYIRITVFRFVLFRLIHAFGLSYTLFDIDLTLLESIPTIVLLLLLFFLPLLIIDQWTRLYTLLNVLFDSFVSCSHFEHYTLTPVDLRVCVRVFCCRYFLALFPFPESIFIETLLFYFYFQLLYFNSGSLVLRHSPHLCFQITNHLKLAV